ncbi:MAG: hypothetical protein JWQ54_1678 [Mucilaginibacter sp.]|nr:hypothetical protein [Mucilaginibacter sp.]
MMFRFWELLLRHLKHLKPGFNKKRGKENQPVPTCSKIKSQSCTAILLYLFLYSTGVKPVNFLNIALNALVSV